MHFQHPPHGEAKLVLCVAGAVFDVAIDLRRSSPSFGKVVATDLPSAGTRMFFIPSGCAHGFLTLEPASAVFYFIDVPFTPGAGGGVRWNDRAFPIDWPAKPQLLSDRDAGYPDFDLNRDAIPQ
jgi:dTDP-4-dehydrorhamnose 3,5-epimerase